MARNRRKRKQQRVEDTTPFRVGKASYGPHEYVYRVWKDNGAFFIKFDGKFAPFTQAEREEDIEPYAQEILTLFLDAAIEEIGERARNAFVVMEEPAHG